MTLLLIIPEILASLLRQKGLVELSAIPIAVRKLLRVVFVKTSNPNPRLVRVVAASGVPEIGENTSGL